MSLQGITGIMEDALVAMSEDAFQKAGAILTDNKNNIREEIQKESSSEIKSIIDKLKSNGPITNQELEFIKLWIVGDAESYSQMENNYQDWLHEFKRIKTELKEYEKKKCSMNDLYKVHGLLEDVIRVSYDIANYLQCKERITKLEKATSDISKIDTDTLVRILTGKLQSPDY